MLIRGYTMKKICFFLFIILVIILIIAFQIYKNHSESFTFIKDELNNQFENGYKDYISVINQAVDIDVQDIDTDDILPESINNTFLDENMDGRYMLIVDSIDEYFHAKNYAEYHKMNPYKIDLELNLKLKRTLVSPFNKVSMVVEYTEIIKINDEIVGYGHSGDIDINLKKCNGIWNPTHMTESGIYGQGYYIGHEHNI